MVSHDQHPPGWRVFLLPVVYLIGLFAVASGLAVHADPLQLPTISVDADQQRSDAWQPVGNSSRLTEQEISHTSAVHAAELLNQLPGVWISRGDGQENLTAIRSPVLTGPGACGAFLLLENGIPIRPAGFCNVNNLFEIDYEQAGEIEVIRGPASALYGGNALHGVINIRNARPDSSGGQLARLEAGEYDFGRLLYSNNIVADEGLWRVDYLGAHDGGWRDDSGYDQQKLVLQHQRQAGIWQVNGQLTGTWLEQETAGFIFGEDAYKKAGLRRDNFNPEAYRNAWSTRASLAFSKPWGDSGWLSLTPYLRSSKMEFLQHFLPEKSRENNGQKSVGLLTTFGDEFGNGHLWNGTLQAEYADGFLKEVQPHPVDSNSPFLIETRPTGIHYDYQVDSILAAGHANIDWQLAPRLRLINSVRLESLRYDYDNHYLDGNSKPDGTPCGFGGCRYTRPADRDDTFNNIGGRLGLNYTDTRQAQWYLTGGYGFRPPQATELYRLQSGQTVADLDSETIRSLEVGHRGYSGPVNYQLTLFAMSKHHVILRDATGSNISNGKTRHQGVELDLGWQINSRQYLQLSATQALHRYAFNSDLPGGEKIRDGDQVDTAPRHMASLIWRYEDPTDYWLELQGQYMGSYSMDAANNHRYAGHQTVDLRSGYALSDQASIRLSVINLTDEDYAERADFAFGNYRYFPGASRQLRLALQLEW